MIPAHVEFVPSGIEVAVAPGTTLHAAALEAGVPIDVPCGGAGLCRGCRVLAHGELSPPNEHEVAELSPEELDRGVRLACMARVEGEATVDVRRSATRAMRVVAAFDGDETGNETSESAAAHVLGVDVGTTTLVVAVAGAETGDEYASAPGINPQVEFGADVMTRIGKAPDHLDAMGDSVAIGLSNLVAQLQDLAGLSGPPERVAVAGNTTMLHILAGVDPSPLGTAPYEPAFLESRRLDPVLLGLPGDVLVETLPGASAFIGADVVAGVVATRLLEREGACVLMDIGTNGEIALKTAAGELLATSAAAGPALEGGGIECGCRAVPGAIERAWIDDDALRFATIDGADPIGLCGTGVIDLVAASLESGFVDETGRLGRSDAISEREGRGGDALHVADGVWLSQADIRAVQLAKSAIATALDMLLERAGVRADEVRAVLVGGGFGYQLDAAALARIGLVPQAWTERTVFVGNSSKAGAVRWAVDEGARREAADVASSLLVVESSRESAFQDRFVANLAFPR